MKLISLKIFTSLFSLIFIISCGPIYKSDYRYVAPTSQQGKQCANTCLATMDACKSQCSTKEAQCRHIARLEGENAYLHYVNARQAQNLSVDKRKRDFYHYGQCNFNSCKEQCEESHRICHVNCGGNVLEDRRCVAFCD
jgi:hypothetical protein